MDQAPPTPAHPALSIANYDASWLGRHDPSSRESDLRFHDLFKVRASWVRRVKQWKRESGETTPWARGGATVIKVDLARLHQLVREQPDATAQEPHTRLGCDCSVSAVDVALRRIGLSYKKRRSMPPSRIEPTWPSDVRSGNNSSRFKVPAA